jgi:hypothetical protein
MQNCAPPPSAWAAPQTFSVLAVFPQCPASSRTVPSPRLLGRLYKPHPPRSSSGGLNTVLPSGIPLWPPPGLARWQPALAARAASPAYPPEYGVFDLLLACLHPSRNKPPFFSGFHRLTVNHPGAGLGRTPQCLAHRATQMLIDRFPGAIFAPLAVITINSV